MEATAGTAPGKAEGWVSPAQGSSRCEPEWGPVGSGNQAWPRWGGIVGVGDTHQALGTGPYSCSHCRLRPSLPGASVCAREHSQDLPTWCDWLFQEARFLLPGSGFQVSLEPCWLSLFITGDSWKHPGNRDLGRERQVAVAALRFSAYISSSFSISLEGLSPPPLKNIGSLWSPITHSSTVSLSFFSSSYSHLVIPVSQCRPLSSTSHAP